MENYKYCPFTRAANGNLNICLCERCAWYIEGQHRCAMTVLAEAADNAADRLEEIAVGDLLEDTGA